MSEEMTVARIPYRGIRRALAVTLLWVGVAELLGWPWAAIVVGVVLLGFDVAGLAATGRREP